MTDEEIQRTLHDAMVNELIRKIRAGEATAADLNVARQYLKDAGFETTRESKPAQNLAMTLPFANYDEFGLTLTTQ